MERRDSVTFAIDASSGGVAVSSGAELLALDAAGNERWVDPAVASSRNVLSLADGGVVDVGRSRVARYDAAGQLVWQFDAEEGNTLDRFAAASRYPRGGFLLMRDVNRGSTTPYQRRSLDRVQRRRPAGPRGLELGLRGNGTGGAGHLKTDTEGAFFVLVDGSVTKVAP